MQNSYGDNNPEHAIKLTEFSHGAGCGCKLSPAVLAEILASNSQPLLQPHLLVGNETSDDAAVYDIGDGTAIVSTTDFFMPIVDDPFVFGQIAATNAISDIYAMGGKPIMAVAILGWPISRLAAETARSVVEGGRQACRDAGIALAGGHSIDSAEPIFGLAVTGTISNSNIVKNSTATVGCQLFLTKPIGVGILSTAQKQKFLKPEHQGVAERYMCQLNSIGPELAKLQGVRAMTDVTGFGLFGHLLEMCRASGLSAEINFEKLPLIPAAEQYRQQGAVPGGTQRNYQSYASEIEGFSQREIDYGCDPQTSGGLLVAVEPDEVTSFLAVAAANNLPLHSFGCLVENGRSVIMTSDC